METEGKSSEEGLIDYKAKTQRLEALLAEQKHKLEEYAKRVMELINEKNELKKFIDNKNSHTPSSQILLNSTTSNELLSPEPTEELLSSTKLLSPKHAEELLGSAPSEELLTTTPSNTEILVDYKSEVRKRDATIKDLNEKLSENIKKTMSIINEKNELKKQLDAIQQKSQTLEDKESKIEGVWKRKLLEAERKVRAIEKILEQKNTEFSNLQSHYMTELSEKDKKIKELKERLKEEP